MIASAPADAPANTEYHLRVLLRTHVWCACALIESRACLERCWVSVCAATSASSSSEKGSEDPELSFRRDCSARNCDWGRERECDCEGRARNLDDRGSGSNNGSALSTNLYNDTNMPAARVQRTLDRGSDCTYLTWPQSAKIRVLRGLVE